MLADSGRGSFRHETCSLRQFAPSLVQTPVLLSRQYGKDLVETMYGYLIDMDGVIYRGSELIPGAERFIHELRTADIPFLFLTNNSQRTRRDVATKLQRLGFDIEDE